MEPGVGPAAFLSPSGTEELSGYDHVVVLRAYQRLVSHFQAQVYREMASISDLMAEIDRDPECAFDSAASEIGAALHLTRRAADSELGFALALRQRLPRVWEALASADLDLRRAKVIVHGTAHLPEATARQVVDQVIEPATRMTSGQLYSMVRRVCIQADPEEAAQRYQRAADDRRVITEPTLDGTAHLLGLDLPPDRVQAAMGRITDLAQSLRREGETRTIDQLRADVLLDLLEGRSHSRIGTGTVALHVDLTTLVGLAENPGELAGYGPVISDIARQVAEQQQKTKWSWSVTDPDTGQTIHTGVTRRRPTASQRRHVEARNRTCIFPGCRMPATNSDLDHRIPWAQGGPTTVDHLDPLCRHHHVLRHRAGWKRYPLPGGDHLWISPLGHTYTTSGRSP
jgi:hypothetical protein